MNTRPANPANSRVRLSSSIIRFRVGPYTMGIEAESLREISRDQDLSGQRRKSLTILSAHEIFGVPTGAELHLLVLNPGGVAIRVDRVERMVVTARISPLPQAFQGEERVWFRGLAWVEGVVFPILDPERAWREAHSRACETIYRAGAPPEAPSTQV